jgi:hypothetical protein
MRATVVIRVRTCAGAPVAPAAVSAPELLHGVGRARDAAIRHPRNDFVDGVLTNVPVVPFGLAEARALHIRESGPSWRWRVR